MAKFYGNIGFAISGELEDQPGVWDTRVVEVPYYGDVVVDVTRIRDGVSINDNVDINNRISVIGDAFVYENFQYMKYVTYMGAKWKITSADIQRPRIVLTLGGVYND